MSAWCGTGIARGERALWQQLYWEHVILDERDYARHVDDVHDNPMKHGYGKRVGDWPYSSFHRDVRAGIFPLDWAGEIEVVGEFGERV